MSECRYCRYREIATATTFSLPTGYDFGCVIGLAIDTLFDSMRGSSGSSYLMKTAGMEGLRNVAMATDFGL